MSFDGKTLFIHTTICHKVWMDCQDTNTLFCWDLDSAASETFVVLIFTKNNDILTNVPPINDCRISNDSSILWGYYSFGKMGQRESGYQPIVESIWLTPTNPPVSGSLNWFFVSLVVPALYFLDFIETSHVNPCVSAHDDFSS